MRRLAILIAVVIAAVVGVDELADLTQSRPDPVRADAVSEVELSVRVDRFGPGPDGAAAALWAVCGAQTRSQIVPPGRIDRLGDGRYRFVLAPAVGKHEQRKLVGCLEDLTIDRVLGNVTSFRTETVAG